MTTPKEALERALAYLDGDSPMHSRGGHRNEVLRVEIRQALASLEGDAVEGVAGLLRKFHRDSCYPEAMAGELNAAVNAVLATGLVAGEAAIRAAAFEEAAKIAESECYATTGRQIAAAIRSGGTNER